MLYLLSPAKSLDYETPTPPEIEALATRPAFIDEAAALIEVLKTKSSADVAALMDLSEPLADLNAARYAAWRRVHTKHNAKPAVLAFDGDVYGGLDAKTLAVEDLTWAQQHLVILSGLYGLLRPLDRLQPYRLEMGTRLTTERGPDLYRWWGPALSEALNRRQRGERERIVVNLASQEYFRAVDRRALRARVVECVFEEGRNGGWQVIGFFAKRARGLMARFAIRHRIRGTDDLRAFAEEGYAFAPDASSPDRLVFRRLAIET
jgi:uncharacterized protein